MKVTVNKTQWPVIYNLYHNPMQLYIAIVCWRGGGLYDNLLNDTNVKTKYVT